MILIGISNNLIRKRNNALINLINWSYTLKINLMLVIKFVLKVYFVLSVTSFYEVLVSYFEKEINQIKLFC